MNNFVTVYELLGLIKDGKAPKLVKYDNRVWQYKEQFDDYFNGEEYLIGDGFDNWDNARNYLNEKVEILEEDKPIIEKIKRYEFKENGITISKQPSIIEIADKLNELIDVVNELAKDKE